MQNLSLFDDLEQVDKTFEEAVMSPRLDVVRMDFIEAESLTWQELFDGFDTLHAITYSSGIGFVYQLLERFEEAEIIFGCDEVISYSLQEIMAYQCKTIERLKDTASKMKLNLVSQINAGTLRFYVAKSVLSHEKIYSLLYSPSRIDNTPISEQLFEVKTEDLDWSLDHNSFIYIWGWPGPDYNLYTIKTYGKGWAFSEEEILRAWEELD